MSNGDEQKLTLEQLVAITDDMVKKGIAATAPPKPDSSNNDLAALSLLKDWSTWLAAIDTALIAGIGALTTGKDASPVSVAAKGFAIAAAGCSVTSLGFACFLFLGLPGIAQRLPPAPGHDIFRMRTGGKLDITPEDRPKQIARERAVSSFWKSDDRVAMPLGWIARGQLGWAFASIVFFAVFVVVLLFK